MTANVTVHFDNQGPGWKWFRRELLADVAILVTSPCWYITYEEAAAAGEKSLLTRLQRGTP